MSTACPTDEDPMTDTPPPALEAWQQPPVVFRAMTSPAPARPSGGVRLATASLVLGIVAVLCNLLLVPTILSIVFGAISLTRDTVARGRAIAGIVLGACGVLAIGVQAAIAVPVFLSVQHRAVETRFPSAIAAAAAQKGVVLTGVRCEPLHAFEPGALTTCAATEPGIGPVTIELRLVNTSGAFEWRVAETD